MGEQAFDLFRWQGLVGREAGRIRLPRGSAVDRDDLRQEGFVAVLEAVRFRPQVPEGFAGPRLEAYIAVAIRRRLRRVAALEWRSKGALLLTVSLDDFLARRGDVLEDIREVSEISDAEALAAMAKCLTDREREVAERLMGFGGYLPRSHAEVGRALGVSQQHVSRIWQRAVKKLRAELGIEESEQ
jgi:RNA polymerase sigma factor (sigma-70 family)